MPNLRLIKAEVLKLRRRPGMLTVAFGLTLGLLALAYLVTAIQHGGNPAKYDAAGGVEGFKDSLEFLSMMGFIMAAIVGSTAGSQDIDSGVFRDLAATGRSRSALFLARVGGAWVVVVLDPRDLARLRRRRGRSRSPTAPRTRASATSSRPPRWCSRRGWSAPRSRSASPRCSARAGP